MDIRTVVDKTLFAGPAPDNDDGTINPDNWKILQNLGIKSTLDLETGIRGVCDGDLLREAQHGNIFGIRVYNHPLNLILPPNIDQITQALKVISLEMSNGKPIYIHCRLGVDRTGFIQACYRIKVQGWSTDQAVNEMLNNGFHLFPYFFWVGALKNI